ncbi:copper homeostasis protein CutC [Fervidibacillus halotolerans]|uniref:PF03932 family protein CutC n=1 Tax=Fervidibacillus halotolerans TaxID=2980027 RepID=A0A9E8LZW3_9BACI|nr:copper homeostasis protein CutC [Fervidibacillus halotolerans]WAA12790.1 copper homeostasis protein CutC [Fervidibacillus halotolerans]
MSIKIEICCGSFEDVLTAKRAGADRVEINSALYLGGLTPSLATVELATEQCKEIAIVPMVRPRPGGFHYNDLEFQTMIQDATTFAKLPIEGVAFGCLDEYGDIQIEQTRKMVQLMKDYGKIAVFHRAFDCVKDPYKAIETLIELGVKRVLTSGQKPKAMEGIELLIDLQKQYGDQIEILVGGGVNETNIQTLIRKTNIRQYHSSCKTWRNDPTTVGNVSFAYAPSPDESAYDIVSFEKAIALVEVVKKG